MEIQQEADALEPIGSQQLATVFAVKPTTIRKWRALGLLQCVLPHACDGPYRSCVIALVQRGLHGTAMSAARWYSYALSEKARILKLEEAAEHYGCSTAELLLEIQQGRRTALMLPAGGRWGAHWRIPAL
jgi:hypothetical protein